jgi:hypothetical protein
VLEWRADLPLVTEGVDDSAEPPPVLVGHVGLLLPMAASGSAAEAHIKSGRWRGVKWEFRGGAWRDGSYCTGMLIRDRENSRACGNVRQQGGIGYSAGGAGYGRHPPIYVMGAVVTRARSVHVDFFDRPPLRLGTVPAPRTLEGGVRFFVAVLPCPATPKEARRARRGRASCRQLCLAARAAEAAELLTAQSKSRVGQRSGMSPDKSSEMAASRVYYQPSASPDIRPSATTPSVA